MGIVVVLTVLVATIGLPHGAADHRFARTRLEPLAGPSWLFIFLAGYLIAALAVLCGWLWAPAITAMSFFLLSAWHFGQEEPRMAIGPQLLRPLLRFARGGLVIWTPILFQPAKVTEILTVIAPQGFPSPAPEVSLIVTFAWVMLCLAAVGWAWQCWVALFATCRKRLVLVSDNVMVASFVALFATMNPLVSFLIYFCGWHSVRGLRRLRRELEESWTQLAVSLTPLTLSAIGMIATVTFFVLRAQTINDMLIRATFVGLSAVAVPHVLLHGAGPLIENFYDRRITTPQLGSSA